MKKRIRKSGYPCLPPGRSGREIRVLAYQIQIETGIEVESPNCEPRAMN
jgi:hypothetical protein